MKRNLFVGVGFVAAASLATAGPKGTIPKASADLYSVHADHDGTRIGAALMSPDEVRRVFGFDVGRSCIVVEVGLYPLDNKSPFSSHRFKARMRPSTSPVLYSFTSFTKPTAGIFWSCSIPTSFAVNVRTSWADI